MARTLPSLLGLLVAALLAALPLAAQEPAPEPPAPESEDAAPAAESRPAPVPLTEIQRFVGVFRAVRDAYVEDIDDRELMQAAIRGLLADLDPHSAYLDRDQAQTMEEISSGAYDGIGLELIQQPDRSLLVIAPIDDTPAHRAGIRPGDVITAIDGEPIDADNVDEAVADLRGPPGTRITLTVLREGEPEPLQMAVVRETIRITSVRGRVIEPGFGYLRLSTFQSDTAQQLRRKLGELGERAPLRGLVLDLRSNPGGLLTAAVEAADTFLDAAGLADATIVSTRGRQPFAEGSYRAHPGDLLAGAPIVILVDSGSASAAEVLAGALRDHRRALIMGERTFGKGSVQTILPLDNGDSIKLTTARYYTPSGRDIQAAGIEPDIAVGSRARYRDGHAPPTVRERDLPRHLQGTEEAEPAPEIPVPAPDAEDGIDDPLVAEALSVLKGLALMRPGPPSG